MDNGSSSISWQRSERNDWVDILFTGNELAALRDFALKSSYSLLDLTNNDCFPDKSKQKSISIKLRFFFVFFLWFLSKNLLRWNCYLKIISYEMNVKQK